MRDIPYFINLGLGRNRARARARGVCAVIRTPWRGYVTRRNRATKNARDTLSKVKRFRRAKPRRGELYYIICPLAPKSACNSKRSNAELYLSAGRTYIRTYVWRPPNAALRVDFTLGKFLGRRVGAFTFFSFLPFFSAVPIVRPSRFRLTLFRVTCRDNSHSIRVAVRAAAPGLFFPRQEHAIRARQI